jgi:hypothetical protein
VELGGCAERRGDKRGVIGVDGGEVGVGDGREREDEDDSDAGDEQGIIGEADLG